MSGKSWKAARRLARQVGAVTDKRERARRSLPAWRVFALALGIKAPARRWEATWERRHRRAMAVAEKKTAHAVVGVTSTEDAPKKRTVTWRPGPQPIKQEAHIG
jgi:hypothetical protein